MACLEVTSVAKRGTAISVKTRFVATGLPPTSQVQRSEASDMHLTKPTNQTLFREFAQRDDYFVVIES